MLSGVLTAGEALAGFGDPVVLLVAGLLVVGELLDRTGVGIPLLISSVQLLQQVELCSLPRIGQFGWPVQVVDCDSLGPERGSLKHARQKS